MKERTPLTWGSRSLKHSCMFKFKLPLFAVGGCEENLNATTELQEYTIALGSEAQSCTYVLTSSSGSGLDVTITDGTTDSGMCGEHEVLYDTRRFIFQTLMCFTLQSKIYSFQKHSFKKMLNWCLKDLQRVTKPPLSEMPRLSLFWAFSWHGIHNMGYTNDSLLLSTHFFCFADINFTLWSVDGCESV